MANDKPEADHQDGGTERETDSELLEIVQESDQDSPAGGDQPSSPDPLADAARQIEELKDQALRARAEMENVRRRAARDVENAHKYALEKFAGDLLPVLDSLEKAVEAAEAAHIDDGGAITEGVGLSLKLFLSTCAKAGIDQVDPHGQPFDPQLHEAIAMVPNPDAEPNSVLEVMQKGYTLNGRLVRAAKVVVARAPDQ